jgi:hypothetical protein
MSYIHSTGVGEEVAHSCGPVFGKQIKIAEISLEKEFERKARS